MSHYAPVFEEIVDSSIWCESDLVVKVFLTLLAKKRRDGVVYGSAFNIAQWAKKTEAEVLEALKVLQSPDTRRLEPQPFDGRRVEKVDGGWLILNAGKYQQRMMEVNKQNQNAQAQARFRERGKANGGQQANSSTGNNGKVVDFFYKAAEVYDLYPRKVARKSAIHKIVSAIKEFGFEKVVEATKTFAAAWSGERDLQFCPHPATWFGQHRFNDDPATWVRDEVQKTPEKGQIQEKIDVPTLKI